MDFVFGLARNPRLVEEIAVELLTAEADASSTGKPARRYKDFRYSTLDSWSRRRRVIAKAEWTEGEANPRFIVTSLSRAETNGRFLYEKVYCARGDMENRIKECQGDLFADRTSTATMLANQLRLWFASMAYVLLCALRRIGLAHSQFAEATCGTIRLKLLKIGALVTISVRRIRFAMASACPYAQEWRLAATRLAQAPRLSRLTRVAAPPTAAAQPRGPQENRTSFSKATRKRAPRSHAPQPEPPASPRPARREDDLGEKCGLIGRE